MIPFSKLHSTDRQNLMDVLPLVKPFTVLVEPSSLCNFRCIQCFQSIKAETYFSRNRRNMPLERFRHVIEQLQAWQGQKMKVLKLSLYGEPLINPDFCAMLKITKEAKIAERVETTTNASLLSKAIAEKLVEYQLDYVRVSIYSPDQERHKAITGSGISIHAIHDNLRVLQEVKKQQGSGRPFVCCKMMDSYGAENDMFVTMYRDVADELLIDKPHGWIRVDGTDFVDAYYKKKAAKANNDLKRSSVARIACPMGFTTLAVRSNGDVSPCCVDFIGGTNIGNVDKQNLKVLWNSGEWHQFLKMQLDNRKHENASCSHCDFYRSSHYMKDTVDGFDARKLR